MHINAKDLTHRQLNEKIREAVKSGVKKVTLDEVNGHRYIASGLKSDVKIEILGTAGNDLASFMSGCEIDVHGNGQDCIANTMNAGKVIIRGSVGDILGYGMRGGKIFIQGNVGYRTGIHMKSYKEMVPAMVIGGFAGDFFAEYMAGGILILLGLTSDISKMYPGAKSSRRIVGNFVGTGMHGGTVYIRGKVEKHQLGREIAPVKLDSADKEIITKYVSEFSDNFGYDAKKILNKEFIKLKAIHHRPYGTIYAY